MAIIFITHDLGVIAETVQRVMVMYLGQVVEQAGVEVLFGHPLHPYTKGLLNSMPSLISKRKSLLNTIPGVVTDLLEEPTGCVFKDRCDVSFKRCMVETPPLIEVEEGHDVRCWHCNRG